MCQHGGWPPTGLGKGPILDRMAVLPIPMAPVGTPLQRVPPVLRRNIEDPFPLVGGAGRAHRGGVFGLLVIAFFVFALPAMLATERGRNLLIGLSLATFVCAVTLATT